MVAAACSSGGDAGSTTTSDHSSHGITGDVAPTGEADRVLTGEVVFTEGFEVPPGEVWVFDADVTTTVETAGNVVVLGTLIMHPGRGDVTHTLRFVDVDESRFVGRGMDPVTEDVGLWVVGDGAVDLQGEEKTGWAYEWQEGWDGDEVIAAPNQPGDYDTFRPVAERDDVPEPNELGYAAELMNLTRNVRIEGTPEGKTHVFIRSTRPQTIRHVAIRYVAPDLADPSLRERSQDQTGRYGLHFHHNGEASRGSMVEGVVIRDADNHAFVPHASHGITFRDTIAFKTKSAAYWWDPTTRLSPGNATNDVLWDHVIAAHVETIDGRDTAFQLGEGERMTVVDSVAVGVQGSGPADSGYHWPGTEQGVWEFRGNIAHNNDANGIFVWQNTSETHVVEDFTAYYNSSPAIVHGAYRNSYVYRGLTLLDNDQRRGGDVAIESHAVGRPASDGGTDMQLWEAVTTGEAVLRTAGHAQDPEAPVRFVDCDFSEVILSEGEGHPSIYEFVDCALTREDFTIEYMHQDSVVRVQDGTAAWRLSPDGAVTTDIAPFA